MTKKRVTEKKNMYGGISGYILRAGTQYLVEYGVPTGWELFGPRWYVYSPHSSISGETLAMSEDEIMEYFGEEVVTHD